VDEEMDLSGSNVSSEELRDSERKALSCDQLYSHGCIFFDPILGSRSIRRREKKETPVAPCARTSVNASRLSKLSTLIERCIQKDE
jgi:hypothetical protein